MNRTQFASTELILDNYYRKWAFSALVYELTFMWEIWRMCILLNKGTFTV